MKKWPYRIWISLFTFCLIALTGCSRSQTPVVEEENPVSENTEEEEREAVSQTRRSPCSTFKIISSLAALEEGLLHPEQSTRTWSGETFWNEQWNQDIDFPDAFRASCVWYFREVMERIFGKNSVYSEETRKELKQVMNQGQGFA